MQCAAVKMMFGAIIVPVQTPPPAAATVTMDCATPVLGAERLPVMACDCCTNANVAMRAAQRRASRIIRKVEPRGARFVNRSMMMRRQGSGVLVVPAKAGTHTPCRCDR